MHHTINKLLGTMLFTACATTAMASTQDKVTLVAPSCSAFAKEATVLTQKNNFLLLQLDQKQFNQTVARKEARNLACGGFVNVSDSFNAEQSTLHFSLDTFLNHYLPKPETTFQKTAAHYSIQHSKEVNQLLPQINPQLMWSNLTTLSNFHDRYANSNTGVEAAMWLKNQIETLAKDNHRDDVTVSLVSTGSSYKQPSVVVKVGRSNEPAVVIGAHMDTLAAYWGNMPGADDDGTGSVTVLETARTLLSSSLTFNKPIYFIWYSAEEDGLVGSQHVVADFKKRNIAVDAVIHFDMTGYAHKNDMTMWLVDDNTNKELSSYLETLINTYVKRPVKHTLCGYECSDHATWTSNGYKAAIAFEAQFETYNPDIHSSEDKMGMLSLDHMTDYTKLAVAFATEMAVPAK